MFLSRRAELLRFWRYSALRQAAILTTTFVGLLILAGTFAVISFEREFDDRIEAELRNRLTVVSADIASRGFVPEAYPMTTTEVVVMLDPSIRLEPGFHDDIEFPGGPEFLRKNQWVYLVEDVGDDRLLIGTNLGRRDEFLEIILQTLATIGFAAAAIALCVGIVFGLRTQKRITAIRQTLDTAASGDLAARVQAQNANDDIDELAHQVDDTLEQLETLIRQTRDFSANIAHDLKTPLARLRIRLETALSKEMGEGDSADEIGAALKQADDVIAIFDAFLRIAKLEAGTAKAQFEPIDLGDLAAQVAEIYEPVVIDRGRAFSLNTQAPATIDGDKVLLVQLLANLIENAMRHTPEGTAITLSANGHDLMLSDTGPGIPSDEYEKVIKPLYRLDKSRTEEGAGLGLSLVQTIADVHGAQLELGENPTDQGPGLSVTVHFPKTG